jgi:hypothetical protein
MSTQYRLVQSGKTANGGCSAGQGSSEPVAPRTGYRLDDRAIEVRYPAETTDVSSSLCVQTGSGAHPASCPMGTGGPSLGAKAGPGRDADPHPS